MQKRKFDPDTDWGRPTAAPKRSAWAEGLGAVVAVLGLAGRAVWFVMVILFWCLAGFGALVTGLLRGVKHR